MSAYFRYFHMENHASRAAFTLLELLLVLMLLSIFAMLGVPALNSAMGDSRLATAAQEVVNALEFAQLTAMTTGIKTRVSVSPTNNTIYVRKYHTGADLFGGGDVLAAAAVEGETWEYMEYPLKKGTDYAIDFNVLPRFKGVKITWSDYHIFSPVYFYPTGYPSKGGAAIVAMGNQQKVVTLDAVIGKVTVSP